MTEEIFQQVAGLGRFTRRAVFFGFVTVTGCLLLLIFVPSLLWSLSMGPTTFLAKETYRSVSPDGRYELRVYRRVNFPTFDVISPPPITVTVDIRKIGAPGAFNSVEFPIHKYSELMDPQVEWSGTQVNIDKIDYHNEYAFTLRFPDP